MAAIVEEEVKDQVSSLHNKVEEEQQQVEVEAQVDSQLQPWEQHSAVIIIPRYDYNAPSTLLHDSHSGFLIICPIKREKSATKEAISMFEKDEEFCEGWQFFTYWRIQKKVVWDRVTENEKYQAKTQENGDGKDPRRKKKFIGCNSFLEESEGDNVTKRRKLCSVDEKSEEIVQKEISKDEGLTSEKNEELVGKKHTLSLVKLTRSGLLLFTSPKDSSLDPVHIVADIHQSIDSGALKSPLCHRILPIQATCIFGEKELGSVVSSLLRAYVNNKAIKFSSPLKFAVGYNRRGIDQMEMKSVKTGSSGSDAPAILDRDKCFATVAVTVKGVVSNAVVDLKCPEICILIECIPLSPGPKNSLVAAVSVLPQSLISTKPKLNIKALISDSKATNGKRLK